MQVQSINNKSNTPSFGMIYMPKYIKWNKFHKPIVNTIRDKMREPLPKFNGQTAEEFYKSKGFDFEITPHSDISVSLRAYKDLREIDKGEYQTHKYTNFIDIGKYKNGSEFEFSDIEKSIKTQKLKDNILIGILLIPILGFSSILGLKISDKVNQPETKPLIENIDSAASKYKNIHSDSIKTATKIMKTIKK